MRKMNRKVLYGIGFLTLAVFLTGCASQEPIVFGEGATQANGLFETLLVYPISWLINFMYELTGNGGLAISLATILMNIVVAPLEIKSQVETKKQQDIQPMLTALQDKYPDSKTDKVQQQKMIMEQQRIYEQNGMSMTGMCLPMIMMLAIQMPLLSAMFAAVRRLKILQSATFTMFGVEYSYGLPDPGLPFIPVIGPYIKIFIIAALLAIFLTSFFQLPKGQRNPKGNQQAMTMYMTNIIFIPLFWSYPIALAIYWIVSNITRMGIRFIFVNKIVEKEHEKFKADQRAKRIK